MPSSKKEPSRYLKETATQTKESEEIISKTSMEELNDLERPLNT